MDGSDRHHRGHGDDDDAVRHYVDDTSKDEDATVQLLRAVPFVQLCAVLSERALTGAEDDDRDDQHNRDAEEAFSVASRAMDRVLEHAVSARSPRVSIDTGALLDVVEAALRLRSAGDGTASRTRSSRMERVRETALRALRMHLVSEAPAGDGTHTVRESVADAMLQRFADAERSSCASASSPPPPPLLLLLVESIRDVSSTAVASGCEACLVQLCVVKPSQGPLALLRDARCRALLLDEMLEAGRPSATAQVRAMHLLLSVAGASAMASAEVSSVLPRTLLAKLSSRSDDVLLQLNIVEVLGEVVSEVSGGAQLLDENGVFTALRVQQLVPFLRGGGGDSDNGGGSAGLRVLLIAGILRFVCHAASARRSAYRGWIDEALLATLHEYLTQLRYAADHDRHSFRAASSSSSSSSSSFSSSSSAAATASGVGGGWHGVVERERIVALQEQAISAVGAIASSDHGMDALLRDVDTMKAAMSYCAARDMAVRVAALHALRSFLSGDIRCGSESCGGDIEWQQQHVLSIFAESCAPGMMMTSTAATADSEGVRADVAAAAAAADAADGTADGASPMATNATAPSLTLQCVFQMAKRPFIAEQVAAFGVFEALADTRYGMQEMAAALHGFVDVLCYESEPERAVLEAKRAVARRAVRAHAASDGAAWFGDARWSKMAALARRPPLSAEGGEGDGGAAASAALRRQAYPRRDPMVDIGTVSRR